MEEETKIEETAKEQPSLDTGSNDYVLIDNVYYYTDHTTNKHFKHDVEKNDWIEVIGDEIPKKLLDAKCEPDMSDQEGSTVTEDADGRKYYHSEGFYLCQDPGGQVYYMDENNAWKPWESKPLEQTDDTKWYFYRGQEMLYRDKKTSKIYEMNKELNEWQELAKRKKKSKRHTDEEFDTDDEELSEYEEEIVQETSVPLGYGSDPNIVLEDDTYTKLDPEDNTKYEWDKDKKAWFPKVDEEFMASYQLSYGFKPDGTKDDNPLRFDDDEEDMEEEPEPPKPEEKTTERKKAEWFDVEDQHNTKVYVTNLPSPITEQEFVDLMQKCGMVLKDIQTNQFKIKLYKDANGDFKGDALCTYIRVESVDLALQILDGYCYKDNCISVERAKFTLKGSYDPKKKPRKKRKKDMEKLYKNRDKLLDWRFEPMRGHRAKNETVVIIKNAFDRAEFEIQAEKILEHTESIRAKCQSFGSVKKVELYDRHPEGVIKVIFAEVEAADMCILTMNKRLYNMRTIDVTVWDGKQKYHIEETDEQEQERLTKWDAFLEKK